MKVQTIRRYGSLLLILVLHAILSPAVVQADQVDLTYRNLGKGLYRLGDTGYIVEHWNNFIKDTVYLNNIKRNSREYNELIPLGKGPKKFLYFIESPRCVNVAADLSGENEIYTMIKELYEMDGICTLALDTYEQYLDWFYMTDHHWNYKGSYKAYCDIIRMVLGKDENLVEPVETVVFQDIPYNGSYHSMLNYSKATELFTVYRFDGLMPYSVLINGAPYPTYGNADRYFAGKYSRLTVYNHYGAFYGGDRGEMIISTDRPELPNLLIFSNSYSNAIVLLLAQHFNHVCVIDTRFYEAQRNTAFYAQKYFRKQDIEYVLVLGDVSFFTRSFNIQ